ncbi:alpha/beta-hydrolase [Penicillium angulare]|uniref:Alpha/beta-hydrolase n=1 Tax=Penicillium angulare TaxID=116970 RepID=A0A9W9K0D0_9EURO|nr:alpha/beta-hydrolase [Penicillium angulare]
MDQPEYQKKVVLGFRKAWKAAPWIPISQMQAHSFRERPLKGPILVSKVDMPAPNEEEGEALRSQLWGHFQATSEGIEKFDPIAPCVSYKGEWIGVRKDVKDPKTSHPDISEQEKFRQIQQNVDNDKTIFYLCGGAFFRAGPPGAKPLIKQLVEKSGSRAFTFQPRLAPQYTIPSILLDVLAAYFYLVAPPPGAFHEPVEPQKIILVGESGGSLCHLHLLQIFRAMIRSARDQTPTIQFNGQTVPITMPLGCALISPGADLTLCLSSVNRNEWFEWMSEGAPWVQRNYPADEIWPTNPPRGDLHCDNSALCHPLIDPSTETDWSGMPPMWIACGEESYEDGIKFLVKNIHASGVPITFVQYEFMPHVWNVILPQLPQSRDTMTRWGLAIKEIGQGRQRDPSAHFVKLGELETVPMNFEGLLDIPKDEVLKRMRDNRDKIAKYIWTGSKEGLAKL